MRTVGVACLALLGFIRRPASARFTLAESYVGQDFLDPEKWNWWTDVDPTDGRVDFVDRETALARNLTSVSNNKFFMRADDTNIVSPDARGRASIRINSTMSHEEAIIVLDVQHMPAGCATWPAFWTLSEAGPWPKGGEVDIIEGVNLAPNNTATLHTDPDCVMPPTGLLRPQTGEPVALDCDANANFNQGCGVEMSAPASYGAAFNDAGGGYVAVLRTKHALEGPQIRIWFWSRADPRVPREIRFAPRTPSIYPTPLWGPPQVDFPLGEQCDYDSHFDPHILTFDLTFCGDWAGEDYLTSGCPSNCIDYVDNNPQAFSEAYWEINSLRVYTLGTPHGVPMREPGSAGGNGATSGSLLNFWRNSRGRM